MPGSLFTDHKNYCDFTLLFCRGRLEMYDVSKRTCKPLFRSLVLLFCYVRVAITVVVCCGCLLSFPVIVFPLRITARICCWVISYWPKFKLVKLRPFSSWVDYPIVAHEISQRRSSVKSQKGDKTSRFCFDWIPVTF